MLIHSPRPTKLLPSLLASVVPTDRGMLVALVRYDGFRRACETGDRLYAFPTPATPHERADIVYLPEDPAVTAVRLFGEFCYAVANLPPMTEDMVHQRNVEEREALLESKGLDKADITAASLAAGAVMAASKPLQPGESVLGSAGRFWRGVREESARITSEARKADRAADDAATTARKLDKLDTYAAGRARGLTPKGTPRSVTLADRKPSAKDERRNRAAMARNPMIRAVQPTTTYRSLDVDYDYEVSGRVFIPGEKG